MEDKIAILKRFEQMEWTTKGGKKIKIVDLELSHMKNIIKMLKRKAEMMHNPMDDFPSFQGEMAQMYAMQQWDHSVEEFEKHQRILKLFKCYYKLRTL
jgi:hypothetical protein